MNKLQTKQDFEDFLKVQVLTDTHKVSRACINDYYCDKSNSFVNRKETVSEHILWCLSLADFYITKYEDFAYLNELKIYNLLRYHDNIEWAKDVGDVSIADEQKRIVNEKKEIEILPSYAQTYPEILWKKFIALDTEFREKKTQEAIFCHAIDKLQPIIYSTQYPEVWWPSKWFDEAAIRRRSQSSFEPFPIIFQHFNMLMQYFNENGYFNEK